MFQIDLFMIVQYVDHFFLKVYFVEDSFIYNWYLRNCDKMGRGGGKNRMCQLPFLGSVVYERPIYFMLLGF